jgi:hypothetical protein
MRRAERNARDLVFGHLGTRAQYQWVFSRASVWKIDRIMSIEGFLTIPWNTIAVYMRASTRINVLCLSQWCDKSLAQPAKSGSHFLTHPQTSDLFVWTTREVNGFVINERFPPGHACQTISGRPRTYIGPNSIRVKGKKTG